MTSGLPELQAAFGQWTHAMLGAIGQSDVVAVCQLVHVARIEASRLEVATRMARQKSGSLGFMRVSQNLVRAHSE